MPFHRLSYLYVPKKPKDKFQPSEIPKSNFVFLVNFSGSMESNDLLPTKASYSLPIRQCPERVRLFAFLSMP